MIFTFINDLSASSVGCWLAFRYAVTGFGDVVALTVQGLAFVLFMISLGLGSVTCQAYLIRRFQLVSGLWYLTAVFAAASGLLVRSSLFSKFTKLIPRAVEYFSLRGLPAKRQRYGCVTRSSVHTAHESAKVLTPPPQDYCSSSTSLSS